MNISLGIIFGLISMISWGMSDFFVTKSARGCATIRAFFWSQIVALIIMFPILFFKLPKFSFYIYTMLFFAGMSALVSNFAFYKSLKTGKVSIVMPIASCWAIVTIFISIIFLGELLTGANALGAIFAIIGVILILFRKYNSEKNKTSNSNGIIYAAIAAFAYGVDFVIIDLLANEIGWFLPIFFIGTINAFMLLIYAGIRKSNLSFPRNVSSFVILVGILDTIAYLFYSTSVTLEFGAIVAPIAATSPAISILLAKIFFKEKIRLIQKMGIVFVLAGLVLLSL
jgi:drug/metabolite transporter (DMT)-like permease